jgi:hypothetical protein
MRGLLSGFAALAAVFSNAPIFHVQPAPQKRAVPKAPGGTGAGWERAAKRLAAIREKNEAIPKLEIDTRQRRRSDDRAMAKRSLMVRKTSAMKNKLPGGAAAVR